MFKKSLSFVTAAILASSSAAVSVSAEEVPVLNSTEYSIGALSTPKIVKVVKYTDSITLKWTKVNGASGYKVYKKVGKKYKIVGTLRSGSTVKFKVKGLTSGKKYSFKVRAFKKKSGKINWSKYSPAKSVVTKADYTVYKPILDNFSKGIYPERPSVDPDMDTALHQYFLYDLDGNGVKEIVLHIGGYRAQSFIYDYNYGAPKYVGTFTEFSNGGGYGRIGRAIYTFTFHGSLIVYKTVYKNNKIVTKTVFSGEDTDDNAVKKVQEYENKMNPFDWYEFDNPSGLT